MVSQTQSILHPWELFHQCLLIHISCDRDAADSHCRRSTPSTLTCPLEASPLRRTIDSVTCAITSRGIKIDRVPFSAHSLACFEGGGGRTIEFLLDRAGDLRGGGSSTHDCIAREPRWACAPPFVEEESSVWLNPPARLSGDDRVLAACCSIRLLSTQLT